MWQAAGNVKVRVVVIASNCTAMRAWGGGLGGGVIACPPRMANSLSQRDIVIPVLSVAFRVFVCVQMMPGQTTVTLLGLRWWGSALAGGHTAGAQRTVVNPNGARQGGWLLVFVLQ
jgi:hypothetical protein